MAQWAIYLDDDLARRVDEAAKRDGTSRSAWTREALERRLNRGLPESFFEVIGSWKDDRTTAEIMREIREGPPDRERKPLD